VEIRLLGPLEVRAGGRVSGAGPPQEGLVLAAVALDAPKPVSMSVVIDRVWGADPPARARTAVAVRVTHLRRLLATVSGSDETWLAWRSGGYVLAVGADQVDLLRFRQLVAAARAAGLSDVDRIALLDEALGLRRGAALDGMAGEWAARVRDAFEVERLEAVLDWGQAALRLGQQARVIPVLRELMDLHPYNEGVAVLLAGALAADGRRDEASEHCRAVSNRLHHDAGIDPGPQLRAAHQALLSGAPVPPAAVRVGAVAAPVAVPAQLPGDVPGFAGRAAALAELDKLMHQATAVPTAVVVTALSGTAGVGKTATAVHWAHQVARRYPDGQLYVNLRGFDPGGRVVAAGTALRGFLSTLGVPADKIPADADAQAALYRSLLAGRKMLVLLDNARDTEQVRPLLPGTPSALTVVTSRNQLTPLVAEGAQPLVLDLLGADEARELLVRALGADRVAAEPAAVRRIVAASAGLPLGLALVAARAAIHPSFPLSSLAAELSHVEGRGDVVARVRAVFSWSYAALSPGAARLFRLLGLHPGPDITVSVAASLAGVVPSRPGDPAGSIVDVRPLLSELTATGLLTEHAPGRYGWHDLLAAYATDLAGTVDSAADRGAAIERLLDHYLHTAHAADRLLSPARDPIRLAPGPPTGTVESHVDGAAAQEWLTAELRALQAARRLAVARGDDVRAWQLAWALTPQLARQGLWPELTAAWEAALDAADRLGRPAAAADAHRLLAWVSSRTGDSDEAHRHLDEALALYEAAGDRAGQGHTHIDLAYAWEQQEEYAKSLRQAEQGLAVYRAAEHHGGEASALNAVGWAHTLLGNHAAALDPCRRSVDLYRRNGDRDGEASAWDSIGYARHALGEHAEAVDCYQRALAMRRDLGDRYGEAETLSHLGETHRAAGDPGAARATWREALEILTDLEHGDAESVREKLAALR
jgi:DNA-binding SARP family transcriptional activator/tetratricopeptide (TPR) repeat protein